MSVVKYKHRRRPFGGLTTRDFFDNEDFFGNRFWNGSSLLDNYWKVSSNEPALNIREEDDKIEIEIAAPGFSKNDFDVTIDNGYLNISAEKSDAMEEKENDYAMQEFRHNSFSKTLPLPENVKEDNIKASYHDGILSFDLTKKIENKKPKPKKIKIT